MANLLVPVVWLIYLLRPLIKIIHLPNIPLAILLPSTSLLLGIPLVGKRQSRDAILIGVLLTLTGVALFPYGYLLPITGVWRRLLALILKILLLPATFFLLAYFGLGAPECNCFFTFVKEGTAKIIVRGDAFDRVLIQWENHVFDDTAGNEWDIIEGNAPDRLFGGFRFYGLWPRHDIYIYNFTWTGVKEDGIVDPHPREELEYILLRPDTYYCKAEGVEDKDALALTVELVLTIEIVNPRKALFDIQNWLETVINRIKPGVRDYIGQKEYQKLIAQKQTMGGELFAELGTLIADFKKLYGVTVIQIEIKDIKPSKDYLDATMKEYVAKQEAKAVVIEAKAKATSIKTEAAAQAKRIEIVWGKIKDFGELGKLIRILESVEKSQLAASLTVQAIPGLSEAFRGVFERTLPSGITREDLEQLKEELKHLREEIKEIKNKP